MNENDQKIDLDEILNSGRSVTDAFYVMLIKGLVCLEHTGHLRFQLYGNEQEELIKDIQSISLSSVGRIFGKIDGRPRTSFQKNKTFKWFRDYLGYESNEEFVLKYLAQWKAFVFVFNKKFRQKYNSKQEFIDFESEEQKTFIIKSVSRIITEEFQRKFRNTVVTELCKWLVQKTKKRYINTEEQKNKVEKWLWIIGEKTGETEIYKTVYQHLQQGLAPFGNETNRSIDWNRKITKWWTGTEKVNAKTRETFIPEIAKKPINCEGINQEDYNLVNDYFFNSKTFDGLIEKHKFSKYQIYSKISDFLEFCDKKYDAMLNNGKNGK